MMLHPALHRYLIEARVQEIRRHGRPRFRPEDHADHAPITIRRARSEDARALARLAALAGVAIPDPPILVAESGGRLRAACSICAGPPIADPQDEGHAAELLAVRAAQLCVA